MKTRLLSVLLSLVLALFAVAGAIAVPILCRPFYYAHIDGLDLVARTGWEEATIREAYDEVMDYLLTDAPFGTGALRWSESGRSHFEDVEGLFVLDLAVTAATAVVLAALFFLCRRVKPHRFLGRGPSFWAGLGLLVVFAVILVLGAADFQRAFVVFHSIFFPGKTNWIFHADTDQIILILPQAYFRNCAILALVVLFALVAVYLVAGRRKKAEKREKTAAIVG